MLGKPLSNKVKARPLKITPLLADGSEGGKLQAGSMTGTSSDDTKVTVEIAPDGLSAKLHPVAGMLSELDADGNPIPLNFVFVGDADRGAGVRPVSETYSTALVEDDATGLRIEEGVDER